MAQNRLLLNADLNVEDNKIINVATPASGEAVGGNGNDAANKAYVDARITATTYAGNTYYEVGDIVVLGGTGSAAGDRFICIKNHTTPVDFVHQTPFTEVENWSALATDSFLVDSVQTARQLNSNQGSATRANILAGDVFQVTNALDPTENGFYLITSTDHVNHTAGTTLFRLTADTGAENFNELIGRIAFDQFPTGGTEGQVLKRTATDGTLEYADDTSEIAARVVISGISVNQVAGTPSETLITFASTQEATEFAATNSIVTGVVSAAITFTLTHDGDDYNYTISPSAGTPPQSVSVSGNTITFAPQVDGVVEVSGATAIVDHTFDHLASGNLNQLTFVDADTARYDVISETVLTDSDAVLPTSGAVHDYVENKFLRDGTPAVQYWEVDGVPNGGPTFTGSGETVAEVLEFSDFRTDDSFRPVFGVDNAPIVDTIAFSINNVGDAAATVNNGDWTVAIEDKYKVIFTKNGQTAIKTLLRGDGSASVVSTDLLCLAFDPMKIPGDNSRAGEKIYIGTENETVLVLDLNEIDFNGDDTITVAVAKYGLRGSLTPSSEQINITALGVHYRKVEHLSVVRWIQTVVFGTSIGSLPWISAEVGEGGNFTNFLDLENAENEGGTTGNIYQSSNDQNNTYETQRGYTLDGGVPFEFSHAAVRSIAWNADADGGITMIAVGNSILRPSQDQSFAEGRVPLFAVGQYWGIPMGPLAAQYLGSDTPTNRQTLFSNLEFSPLTYLGVVSGGISAPGSIYPGGFKTNFLHNQLNTKAGIDIDNDLNVIHLSDIVYQEGTGAGFYMVGQRLASDSDYHGIGLFVDFQEFSLVTYNRDNTYLRFEKGLTNERASRVKIIDSLTKLGDNDNSPYHKLYFRNNTGDASDRNIIAFGNNRQALEVNTTVTTGSTAFALSTIDQFEELVNSNDGPFFDSSDNFWGGFIPNKNDFSKTTVLWGTRSSVDVASSIFNAFRIQQEIVEIKFFDHSSPTAGPTLSIPKTNGEDIRSFAEKFAAHFGSGQTFPNGTATLIPATDPNVSESAITIEFDPDTTKADDFTITVHVNNFNLLQPVNAGQTQYSLPITESFELEVVSGTTDLILGYQLAVPSFDGLPNFDFSVTVGGQDARSGATLVNGLLELNATTVADLTDPGAAGDIVTVNYLQASDEFYDFNEDLATIISYIDPYSGTNTIRGSFKISLDHTFNNENELAAFLVSELEASGLLTSSVEARVVGTELIFEIGLNSKGPILHENQKISIVVDNPVLDPINADPLMITRRLNGETDETGSESGPIDLREVPSRDEMIDFIEAAIEDSENETGIDNIDVINSTRVPFRVNAVDEELLLSGDPLTTRSYVDLIDPDRVVIGADLGPGGTKMVPQDHWLLIPNSVKHYLFYNHGSDYTIGPASADGWNLAQIAYEVTKGETLTLINNQEVIDYPSSYVAPEGLYGHNFYEYNNELWYRLSAADILINSDTVRLANQPSLTNADWLHFGGTTNLSNTPKESVVTVESSTGTNTDLPGATASVSGIVTAADFIRNGGIYPNAVSALNNDFTVPFTVVHGSIWYYEHDVWLYEGDSDLAIDTASDLVEDRPAFGSDDWIRLNVIAWHAQLSYFIGDLVEFGGVLYTATANVAGHSGNSNPSVDTASWSVFNASDVSGSAFPTTNRFDGRVFHLDTHLVVPPVQDDTPGWYIYREAAAASGSPNDATYVAAITAGWFPTGEKSEGNRIYPDTANTIVATVHAEPFEVTPGIWHHNDETFLYTGDPYSITTTGSLWLGAPTDNFDAVRPNWERLSAFTNGVSNALSRVVTTTQTMAGQITFADGQTFPGTASSAQGTAADNALARSGGTMTGDIVFNTGQTFPGAGGSVEANGTWIPPTSFIVSLIATGGNFQLHFTNTGNFISFLTALGLPTTAGPQSEARGETIFTAGGVDYTVGAHTWVYDVSNPFINFGTSLVSPGVPSSDNLNLSFTVNLEENLTDISAGNGITLELDGAGTGVGTIIADVTPGGNNTFTGTVNDANANAMAYVAIQFTAGIPVDITDQVANPVTGFIYLRYTANYKGDASNVLVDVINTTTGATITYDEFSTQSKLGDVVPQS